MKLTTYDTPRMTLMAFVVGPRGKAAGVNEGRSDNARLKRLLTKAMRYPSAKPFRGGSDICRCECAHVISFLASS